MLSMMTLTLVLLILISLSLIAGFLLIYAICIGLTRYTLLKNSKKISRQSNKVIKVLQEGLGGIRDVLIDGSQDVYCKTFRKADLSVRQAYANNAIIGTSPRYIVESVGMVLIALVAYTISKDSNGLMYYLPILGAIALAAQRMMPMLQQTYSAIANIRGSQEVLVDAITLLKQKLPSYANLKKTKPMPFNRKISIEKLCFRYKENLPHVLKNINLTIPKGSKIGFIGKTGSDKTLVTIRSELIIITKQFQCINYK